MKMAKGSRFTAVFFSFLLALSFHSHSATINVSTAEQFTETLQTAEHGDVIIVASGTYDLSRFSNIDITKAITIIGESLLDPPVMYANFRYRIPDGTSDMHLVFQNLKIPSSSARPGLRLREFEGSVIGSISVIDVWSHGNDSGVGIDIRGTTLNAHIVGAYVPEVYVSFPIGAGQTTAVVAYSILTGGDIGDQDTTDSVEILNASEAFLIGNRIDGSLGTGVSAGVSVVDLNGTIKSVTMFGNHLRFVQYRTTSNNYHGQLLELDADTGLVSNNLFTVEPSTNGQYIETAPESVGHRLRAIDVDADNEIIIQNNIFDYSYDVVSNLTDRTMIRARSPITLKNNIFKGNINNDLVVFSSSIEARSTIVNNICHETGEYCFPGDSNVSTDPQFSSIDLSGELHERIYDYTLLEGSPAINAGLEGTAFFDVDGSRVDIGYNGGATPFDQYSRTIVDYRNDTVDSRPYIVPLIRASQGVAGDNTLRVKFLTFARSR